MVRFRIRAIPAFAAVLCSAALLQGCTAQRAYQEGNALVAQQQVGAGLAKYREAVAADPGNALYRAALLRARDATATRLVEQAERELAAGRIDAARTAYQQVLEVDPANERGRAGMRQIEADRRHSALFEAARLDLEKKDVEAARQKLGAILSERPGHEGARQLLVELDEKAAVPAASSSEATLAASFRKPISLEFRDAPLRQVFEIIARHSGLNFVFDKDVRSDGRTSIFLKNSTVEAAVHFLLVTNQLERQVMDGNTILIYPNSAAKLKEYQELTVKTFYLANADAKSIANTFKTILKSRDVVVDEKLNLVILRDSPEAVKLATQLVALQDVAEPEVMLDVEVLEIKRSRIMDLGVAWPQSLGFAPLIGSSGAPISIDELRGLNSSVIGVTGVRATVNANKTDSDSNTLANPRIRVRNKEKAKVVIGDKVPNITTNVSPATTGSFLSQSINYVDVGLTLNVEPTIYLNNEVGIRISLEVSNLVDTIQTENAVAYRIGTRSATTMLQLKDGENQVLAGLINSEDRSSGSKVPGVGNLPILGRLFGSTRDTDDKTEIVLSITPHLVRTVQRPPAGAAEFSAGTESSFRRRPDTAVRLPTAQPTAQPATRPAVPVAPPLGQPATPAVPSVTGAPLSQPIGTAPAPYTVPPSAQPGVQVTPIPAPPATPPATQPVPPPGPSPLLASPAARPPGQ
ncbi:secretin N-terminal domain-containing protein [Massilia sp. Mn16-1_5]|uniref:secretin N-terminal domain-containing protein n=1 Tax=Massilia sp. Mn16-1_5 TaxID=2079199 RepID=UPI00109E4B32|nr:secretin N-terminal domain-containing protein [Massilia sp. Mn16-1_5]THC44871.1 general secretion pathway protein GspD [Massilia sp. Mn16-1_5]